MRVLRLLLCACLPLWLLAAPARAGDGNPFVGVWYGVVTEMRVAGSRYDRYEVNIEIVPGAYSMDYPTLGCGGRMELQRKEDDMLQFQEKLEYGKELCSSGGRTILRMIQPGVTEYLWFDEQGALKVQGLLKRQRQWVT